MQTHSIEKWLSDILFELDTAIKKEYMNAEDLNPLKKYRIEKSILLESGINKEMIERIYHGLYVHSMGFFHLINEATRHLAQGKDITKVNIWRAFQRIQDKICKTEFEGLISTMITDHMQEIKDLEEKHAELTSGMQE